MFFCVNFLNRCLFNKVFFALNSVCMVLVKLHLKSKEIIYDLLENYFFLKLQVKRNHMRVS